MVYDILIAIGWAIIVIILTPFVALWYAIVGFWQGMVFGWEHFRLWIVMAWTFTKDDFRRRY